MSANDGILSLVQAAIGRVGPSPVLAPLRAAFVARAEGLLEIEAAFRAFTDQPCDELTARHFFHNWSCTNHSAMCVSGISNRMTRQMHLGQQLARPARLVDAVVSLNRISDEDLGVGGGKLHADLFRQMADPFCGDDSWLLQVYARPAAEAFSAYRHKTGLRNPDVMDALLMTTVHEVYTHGEVEFILPLFQARLARFSGLPERQQRLIVAWIFVHCGPTEQTHFRHAVEAVDHYVEAHGLSLEAYDLVDHFTTYLDHKIAVMADLLSMLKTRSASRHAPEFGVAASV